MLYNGHTFTNKYGEKFRRVNKTEARNRARAGQSIGVCACNMDPFNPYWNMCAWYHPEEERDAFDGFDTFDKFVNSYECYNCSHETGYYASYYIQL